MEITIGVYGMTCGHCQKRVADAISSLEGVGSVEVNLEAEHATINFNPQKVSLDNIKKAIQKAGYSTEIEEKTGVETEKETGEAQANAERETSTVSKAEGAISEAAKTSETAETPKTVESSRATDTSLKEPKEGSQTCPLDDSGVQACRKRSFPHPTKKQA